MDRSGVDWCRPERMRRIGGPEYSVEQTEHPAAESGACQLGGHHWLGDTQNDLAKAEDDTAQVGRGQSQDGGFETKAKHDNDPAQGPEQWHGHEHQDMVA